MGSSPRELAALLGALALHATAWAAVGAAPHAPASAAPDTPELEVEIETPPAAVAERAPLEPASPDAPLAAATSPRLREHESEAERPAPTAMPEPAPSSSAATAFVFSPLAAASASGALANDALGIGGRNRFVGGQGGVDVGPSAAAAPSTEPNVAPGIDQSLHDALDARDHELGLDADGKLVAVAEEVTRPSDAPMNGRAIVEITVDENGNIARVQLVDSSTARGEWERVASRLGETLRARRVQVRRHGAAMVVTMEISSRWVMPSGSNGGISSPKFGASDGPSVSAGFDVTDIGAKPIRDVHARVLRTRRP